MPTPSNSDPTPGAALRALIDTWQALADRLDAGADDGSINACKAASYRRCASELLAVLAPPADPPTDQG